MQDAVLCLQAENDRRPGRADAATGERKAGVRYFRIRNWSRFQHYSNRAPIWIKLYTDMIEDQKGDWAGWTDTERGQIVGIWQLAAKMGNCIPYNDDFVASEIMATDKVDLSIYGNHLEVYPSKKECLDSDSARLSMVRCSSLSLSRSSSSESEASPSKYGFASNLLRRHSRAVPEKMTNEEANSIIDELKDLKVSVGARAPVDFPDDLDLNAAEREESTEAHRKATQ